MDSIEVIFAAITASVVGLILYMLRSAYGPANAALPKPVHPHAYLDDTPLGALESYVRERIEGLEKPGMILALKTRLEMEDADSDSERRLLYLELISDLDRLQPEPLPSTLRQILNNPLATLPAKNRDGAALRIAVEEIRDHLGGTLGQELTTQFLVGFPKECGDGNLVPWNQALQSGNAAIQLQLVHSKCSEELGQLKGTQILESAARKVGRLFPLSCLKGFLGAFPGDLLSAEKASASARDRIWDEFLAARQDLDRAQVRLAEVEMNKWASVGRLAAGMAHEINNPLAYIMGNLSLLTEELVEESPVPPERPEQLAMLNDAMTGLNQIRNIVSDLQVFSRTRRAKKQAVDLEAALRSTIKIVNAQIGRGITFTEEFSSIPKVIANEGKIGQVLLNLLVNASQSSMEAGKTHIIVRTTQTEDAVCIEVEDLGCGVPSELCEQIFEPFFTTKEVDQGTGLGLAISREIAEQHGGSLGLDTSYTQGARFQLTLPTNLHQLEPETPAPSAEPVRPLRILFVDDDEAIQHLATRSLGKAHTLTIATDGIEAKEYLQASQDFDVIVLDLHLPKLSGNKLFVWLEHQHPELASRVLIMSGGATTALAADFLADHSHQTLNKPASLDEIEQAILRIANAHSAA